VLQRRTQAADTAGVEYTHALATGARVQERGAHTPLEPQPLATAPRVRCDGPCRRRTTPPRPMHSHAHNRHSTRPTRSLVLALLRPWRPTGQPHGHTVCRRQQRRGPDGGPHNRRRARSSINTPQACECSAADGPATRACARSHSRPLPSAGAHEQRAATSPSPAVHAAGHSWRARLRSSVASPPCTHARCGLPRRLSGAARAPSCWASCAPAGG
jgi:hypothetical protein